MSPEEKTEALKAHYVRQLAGRLISRAWRSIAEERGYRFDNYLGTTSHGTIAIRHYLSANGV